MFGIDTVALALIFITLGILLAAGVRTALSASARAAASPAIFATAESEGPDDEMGLLVVVEGGTVRYANRTLRDWLNLPADARPNLEHLARRTRPAEAFLDLCATPGHARFAMQGMMVDGTSISIPYPDRSAILITLKRPDITTLTRTVDPETSALHVLSELSVAMTASSGLASTVEAILESVERLIPADMAEITVWDADEGHLIPFRLAGLPGVDRKLDRPAQRYRSGEGYSGKLFAEGKPLVVNRPEGTRTPEADETLKSYPFQSYLGVPLHVAGEPIGTLELGSLTSQSYSDRDLETLLMLSNQAAIALRHALTREEEERRVAELAGLANLTQAVSVLRDSRDVFTQLLNSILPLLDVEVLGFLLYDDNAHRLQGQVPFTGIPDHFVQHYFADIEPGSPGEEIWHSNRMIVAHPAGDDPDLIALNLAPLAQATGIVSTALVPLTAGGRTLGFLQAGNKRSGAVFGPDELRLLTIIAGQSAAILDNASLIAESRRRTRQAEALRRIAALASSAATLEEILLFSLTEVARLIGAPQGAFFLLDQERYQLAAHTESLFGIGLDLAVLLPAVKIEDPRFASTVTASQQLRVLDRAAAEHGGDDVYGPLLTLLDADSALAVPLIVRDRAVGEMLLASPSSGLFRQTEVELASTAAGQIAGAIERAFVATQTDEALRRRVEDLTALTRAGRELNASADPDKLARMIQQAALEITGADCGTTILFDPGIAAAGKLTALTWFGDSPQDRRQIGAFDMEKDWPDAPVVINDLLLAGVVPPHVDIRAVLLQPIAGPRGLLGLIELHSRTLGVFDERKQEAAGSLATQAAISLTAAFEFQEEIERRMLVQRRLDARTKLAEMQRTLPNSQSLAQATSLLSEGIRAATGFRKFSLGRYDQESGELAWPAEASGENQDGRLPWVGLIDQQGAADQFHGVVFIAANGEAYTPPAVHKNRRSIDEAQRWRRQDQVFLPLIGSDGLPLGAIRLDSPINGLRPDQATYETAAIFGAEAAALIQRFSMPVKQEEQTGRKPADPGSQIRAGRIEAALEIIRAVSRQTTRGAVFDTLGSEFVKQMGFDVTLVAEPSATGALLATVSGNLPESVNAEALLGQRNPLRQTLLSGETQLVGGAEANGAGGWRGSPLLTQLGARAFVCLPIHGPGDAGKVEAAVLAVSSSEIPEFSTSDLEMFNLIGKQAATALQNAALLEQTRERLREVNLLLDFSRRLGRLEPGEILNALRDIASYAVPAAQASLVTLWDARIGRLVPVSANGYRDPAAMMSIHYSPGASLPGKVYQSGATLRIDELNIAVDTNLPAPELLRYQEATGGRPPIASLAAPIAAGGSVLGVILLDNFTEPSAFQPDDEVLIASLARQTGLVLENARLLDEANRRAVQLSTLTDVATTITSNLQVDVITSSLLDHLGRLIPYNTGTFWFRQAASLVIRATHGFEDDEERVGLSVSIEDSQLLGEMIATGQAIHVPNVHEDARFLALPEFERLSWLGIPLLSKGEVVGVIALEKNEAFFYEPEHIQLATTFAGQAAVAFENARLLEESMQRAGDLNERSQRLDLLNRLSTEFSASLDTTHILQFTAEEVRDALGCRAASAVLFDEDGRAWQVAASPGPLDALPAAFNSAPFEHLRESLGVMIVEDLQSDPALTELASASPVNAALVLSLATGEDLHGLLILLSESRLSSGEIDLARTISRQVSVAIQNALLYDRSRKLAGELEQRVEERTRELEVEHQRTETLLGIITELSASLDMDIVLNRTLSLLNRITGAEQATIILSNPADVSLIRRASQGYTEPAPEGGIETTFDVNEGLAGWVIRHREPVLIQDVRKDPRWVARGRTSHRSAIAIPLMLGAEALGALMLFHRKAGRFSAGQLDLIQAAAKQIAVAVNNAHLYLLIRDQAERLGGMLRSQQIEASRLLAILEAVVDGVLVTDGRGEISIFNRAGEAILGLAPEDVVGHSLDHFTGLFGRAARKWMDTIRAWSADPGSFHAGETFSEQIRLDNDRVVAVNLAPVATAREFLGTVSIFRDITHMIEVDRMKSDFVATVSHELRTPMTSIKGYVDILLMGAAGQLSDQQQHFLEVVQANTERLNILVNDLLEVSRIEAGKVALSVGPVDLQGLAGDVVTDYRLKAQEERRLIEIRVEPAEVGEAMADAERIRQIFNNLIGNAYNYTPDGGWIRIGFRRLRGYIEVEVRDTGVGISPEDQEKIFERFYRGEAPLVSSVSGTGLGLSITKYLVELHGGQIRIVSRGIPGEGSAFFFTIPTKG